MLLIIGLFSCLKQLLITIILQFGSCKKKKKNQFQMTFIVKNQNFNWKKKNLFFFLRNQKQFQTIHMLFNVCIEPFI